MKLCKTNTANVSELKGKRTTSFTSYSRLDLPAPGRRRRRHGRGFFSCGRDLEPNFRGFRPGRSATGKSRKITEPERVTQKKFVRRDKRSTRRDIAEVFSAMAAGTFF